MAAQDRKTTAYCEKCFSLVPADQGFCPECGAPMATQGLGESSDTAMYPELARANLLRMRGEYKQAEDVCLAILRRFPNNASANTLLGDISAEVGELDRAIQWYELALDLQPGSAADKQKLAAVRQRKTEREAATTAARLGMPARGPRAALSAVLMLVFLVAVGLAAFYIGRNYVANHGAKIAVVDLPVEVPANAAPHRASAPPPTNASTGSGILTPREDQSLMLLVTQALGDSSRVMDVTQDPRGRDIMLTYSIQQGEDDRAVGARMASTILEKVADAKRVILRAVRDNTLVLVADVWRDDVVKTTSPDWQASYGHDTAAWVNTVVTNEWRP